MPTLPTRVLAGVAVPDSPLITKALSYTQAHLKAMAYNPRRTFLALRHHHRQQNACPAPHDHDLDLNLEIYSTAALLHDPGWDSTGALVSADKRFEVDGANAARDFLGREAPDWDGRKIQLVWDAIALHTTASRSVYKEAEVEAEVAATTCGHLGGLCGARGGGRRAVEQGGV